MDFEEAVVVAHRQQAPGVVGCFVLCCSDSRNAQEDLSGQHIQQLLKEAGHKVYGYKVVVDEPVLIQEALELALGMPSIEVVLMTGGTGIGQRDATVQVLGPLLEKPLPGFGELFRMLSYKQIESAAMLSRAMAGSIGSKCIFAMPGSKAAVDLAMRRLILPELGHVVRELSKR
ncbi:MAG: MogA/MoaB family molybdenum cofactor biosynthesis protein [Cystobacterineae bacterium]|nr:MogA/MoaB family molybdenum cofactor biosynthesis protein [Cystobacterineae bacterium]